MAFDPKKVKVKRPLVLPTLKLVAEEAAHVRIETKMVKSTVVQEKGGKKMDPATVCHVTNMETGERCTLICGAVLESTLNESYPGDKYVGLCFRVIKHEPAKGKKYATYSLDEIEA